MIAHSKFNDASELFLKSHSWLVNDYHLADLFVKFITTVPESSHDRVDYLQAQLDQSRRETLNAKHEFEDYKVRQTQQRVEWVKRTIAHQQRRIARTQYADCIDGWSYLAQRQKLQTLTNKNDSLQALGNCGTGADLGYNQLTEHLKESQRRWLENKAGLIKERDEYKKKWMKMVKAHEQAMADLKRTEGTAEGQRTMILVLTQEKAELESKNEILEEQKRVMTKQLAELRDELAKIRQEVRRMTAQIKETEAALVDTRLEVERAHDAEKAMENRLDDNAILEATLREEVLWWKAEHSAGEEREIGLQNDLANERQRCADLETLRDQLYGEIEVMKNTVRKTIQDCKDEVHRVKVKAKKDLEAFKEKELLKVKEDFQKKTDVIVRRNELLEKEVTIGDTLGPHLSTLNPIACDDSRLCPVCRRVVVFEGAVRD